MKTQAKSSRPLGSLEEKVMSVLWRAGPLSVREMNKRLGEKKLAYTTVMTTLDRLYKKGLLSRSKDGLAYVYRAELSRDEYQRRLARETVSGLMSKGADAVPVLAAFVDVAARLDGKNLAKLEALIAERRRAGD
ncbi:MAG: BlaI/MecI/CopY family transcriptional regulator [Deltaproteobacteria bacterium]|nr:BlaI/MecI/CopY family transcriptional regulator [Deltaproteobacteria bacterium]